MSDLAPFVAAALRDKVVMELQDELRALKAKLNKERRRSQLVEITGPRGQPVYARTSFKKGNFDYSPELWKVEFPSTGLGINATGKKKKKGKKGEGKKKSKTQICSECTLSELGDMEVRIGGVCKARLANGIVEGFVNDIKNNYDEENKSGVVSIWFGGSSGIWLNIKIYPIEREQYAALRDFDLGGNGMLNTFLQFFSANTKVTYTEVSFLISYINGAMERWGIAPEPKEEGEENRQEVREDTGEIDDEDTESNAR